MKKWLFGLIGVALLSAGWALAQVPCPYCIASPLGTEQIQVTAPSTSGTGVLNNTYAQTITVNQIRNASGMTLVGAGTTVATQALNTSSVYLATGAITTWNVTFPTAPFDGEELKEGCPGGNVGTIANTASLPAGVTIVGVAFTACTAASQNDAQWHYSKANNIWYRSE